MDIKYSNSGGDMYAELSGELDEYSAEYVRITLDDLLVGAKNIKKLILDFSKVSFMDSTSPSDALSQFSAASNKVSSDSSQDSFIAKRSPHSVTKRHTYFSPKRSAQ